MELKFTGKTYSDYIEFCNKQIMFLENKKRFWEQEIENKRSLMRMFDKKLSDVVM